MGTENGTGVNVWRVVALVLMVILAAVVGAFLMRGGASSDDKKAEQAQSGTSVVSDDVQDAGLDASVETDTGDTAQEAASQESTVTETGNSADTGTPETFDGKDHDIRITFSDGLHYTNVYDTTVYLIQGKNNPTGTPIRTLTTNANGQVRTTLPAGDYTLVWGDKNYYDGMENLSIGGEMGAAANFIHDSSDPDDYVFWRFMLPRRSGNAICMILEWKGADIDLDLCVFNAKEKRYISSVQPEDGSGGFLVDDDIAGSQGWEVVVIQDHTKSDIYTPYVRDGKSLINGTMSAMETYGVRFSVVDHNGLLFSQQADPSEHAPLWMPCYIHKGKVIKDSVYEYDPSKSAWAAYRKQ